MQKRMRRESVEAVDIDWKVVVGVKNSALVLVREILERPGKNKRRKKRQRKRRESVEAADIDWKVVVGVKNSALELAREI